MRKLIKSTAAIAIAVAMFGALYHMFGRTALQSNAQHSPGPHPDTWRFASSPDFLNADCDYPDPYWEPVLQYVTESVKAEQPDFLLVAGDIVMGRWRSTEEINELAPRYYSAWKQRLDAAGLKYYVAIGDHEIGDDPWHGNRARLVPQFRRTFVDAFHLPMNGPGSHKGTAYWFVHRNVLFITLDVFMAGGDGPSGDINAGVRDEQLHWLRDVVVEHRESVDFVIVQGHTPILYPVTERRSSDLHIPGGDQSPLWRTFVACGVDVYLCGEVHSITCTKADGVWQIAHGASFGMLPDHNYMVADVTPERLTLTLKQIAISTSGPHRWQAGSPPKHSPNKRLEITKKDRQRGYRVVEVVTIDARFQPHTQQ